MTYHLVWGSNWESASSKGPTHRHWVSPLTTEPPLLKGVGWGGGPEVKFCFRFYFIDSENLEYVGSGTFYRIEKACSIAEM